ncbi:MAG: hypothetical protein CMH65_08925 [Nevskiales bacterium]|nr:hypothetical protein [Nevskiales bacterium]
MPCRWLREETNTRTLGACALAIVTGRLFIWQHDIQGNAPGPAGNFVQGRKTFNLLLEATYRRRYSATIAYNAFFGAGENNLYQDRDNLGLFLKYQF